MLSATVSRPRSPLARGYTAGDSRLHGGWFEAKGSTKIYVMDSDVPWYRDGLRFRCTLCGACCAGEPGYVWLTDEETAAIAVYRKEPLEEFIAIFTRSVGQQRSLRERVNGDCIFYDRAQGCTIYPVRPRQCRTWPFWESNVATAEDWEETCVICPGSGKGELISAEEITARMKAIKL